MSTPSTIATSATEAPRAIKILAKSTFRELKSSGYSRADVLAFATEMLALVKSDYTQDSVIPSAE